MNGEYVNVHLPYTTGSSTTYNFSLGSSPRSLYQYGPGDASIRFFSNSNGSYSGQLTVIKSSPCGTATETYNFYNVPSYGYQIAPNPASGQVTVAHTDSADARPAASRRAGIATSSAAGDSGFIVRLYDNYGTQQLQQATTTTLQLDTGSLPAGLYLLHIEAGGVVVERRRVQIIH